MNRKISIVMMVVSVLFASGCATMKGKFTDTKSVNLAPFADQTMILLSSLNYDLSPNDAYRFNPYLDSALPAIKEMKQAVSLERVFLRGMMDYSVEILNLSESSLSEQAQVAAYRIYLSNLAHYIISSKYTDSKLSEENVGTILTEISKKATLLEALQAARPLILEFNQINIKLIRDITDSRDVVTASVAQNLDNAFHGFVDFEQTLRQQKLEVLNGLTLVSAYKKGDRAAMKKIEDIPGLLPESEKGKSISSVEAFLRNRLKVLVAAQDEIKMDLKEYQDLRATLDRVKSQHDEMVRAGARAVLLWSQAHQKMASGLVNSAEWFGMSDVKGMVTGAAKSVAP